VTFQRTTMSNAGEALVEGGMSAASRSILPFNRSLFSTSLGTFSPRVGKVILRREDPPSVSQATSIEIETPAALTWTSRGIVPHLTRDHVAQSDSAGWVHVPFESLTNTASAHLAASAKSYGSKAAAHFPGPST